MSAQPLGRFLMEIIGRRWTIAYALAGSLPGLFLMLMAHRLITGFTVLFAFTATRVSGESLQT
jgi:hypothetical protein